MQPRRWCLPALSVLVVLAALGAPSAQAGMFDDEEARQQIKDLRIQSNERLETLSKGQFELLNQIQALREENARLRGQVETLVFELDSAKKRQQDFYVDLDGRLRKLETQATPPAEATAEGGATPAQGEVAPKPPATDPTESRREDRVGHGCLSAVPVDPGAGRAVVDVEDALGPAAVPDAGRPKGAGLRDAQAQAARDVERERRHVLAGSSAADVGVVAGAATGADRGPRALGLADPLELA